MVILSNKVARLVVLVLVFWILAKAIGLGRVLGLIIHKPTRALNRFTLELSGSNGAVVALKPMFPMSKLPNIRVNY